MRKRRLKKIVSCVLCAAVLLVNVPFVSYATGDGEDKGALTIDPVTVDPVADDDTIEDNKAQVSEASTAFSWETLVPQTPAEGNVMAGFSGAYYVETAETILNRINEIRREACQEGIKDPHTGKVLTEADYKPLKWSSDLEAIARLRAAEASFKHGHDRPNGERCFSIVTTNNEKSWAENLAWNYSGIMQGIEQWYEEKADWVNGNTSAVTGHYESLISTRYNHMAIGCFRLSSGGWYAVAQEFSDESGLDERQDTSSGECVQDVEIPLSHLKSVTIEDSDTVSVQAGETDELVLNTVASFDNYYGDGQNYNCVINSGVTWTSSDTSVATVDASGKVTAFKVGTTTVQATAGTLSDTITVDVSAGEVRYNLETDATIVLAESNLTYNGTEQQPALTVKVGETELVEDEDYTTSYTNNKNVGTATVTVTGQGHYQGSKTAEFTISQAKLTIKAKDLLILIGESLPEFQYEITGLAEGEKLVTEPTYTCNVTDLSKAGEYEIVPSGAIASDNYDPNITYVNGKLIVSEEKIIIKDIEDVYYTGKACKPSVQIYDDGVLLKANTDYKVTYYNNISANQKQKTGNGTGSNFDKALPHVQITGKGNYSGTNIQINFNILPAVIGNGGAVAKGFTMKTNSQLVANATKALNPFVSIKGSKSMKKDVDYTLRLSTVNAYATKGGQVDQGTVFADGLIPAGYSGSFRLDITGKGNYSGSISTEIFVADKSHLMKNASIKIGKNIKKQTYTGQSVTLTPGYYDSTTDKYFAVEGGRVTDREVSADDVFTVCFGKTGLIYQKDYTITYQNNTGVGKATMTITGKGEYAGTKAMTFQIAGATFSAKYVQIQGLENKTYTGNAITQNNVKLIYSDTSGVQKFLEYGKHYTISYKNNINKGTATMTFTALPASGYQGKISKSFKIQAVDLANMKQSDSMKNISVEYEKAGVTPYEYVQLTQSMGKVLVYGKDYTVSYRNNKFVAKSTDSAAPTMIIKGKGNYTGIIEVPFTITQGDLSSDRITMVSAMVSFNPNKAADAEYKPAVMVTDGKKRLSAGKDYTITYVNNTQEKCKLYLEKYKQGTATSADMPKAIITAAEGSCYKSVVPIEVPLSIYETKLSSKNLYVVVSEAAYTGEQVKPAVAVYYHEDSSIVAQAKGLIDEQKILALGLRKLEEGENYTLSYGKNVAAGKNKGSVKISGASPLYGGSVTVKFTINGKKIVR